MNSTKPLLDSNFIKPEIHELIHPLLASQSLRVSVLRLDKINDIIQGNKWYKLKHNLEYAAQNNKRKILSFGGAYSNHLLALAAAGSVLGFETIGIVRGELIMPLNPVLKQAAEYGMTLIPMSRGDYKQRHNLVKMSELVDDISDAYVIPEGGANRLGVLGCEEIAAELSTPDLLGDLHIALASGTGTTMAGLVNGLSNRNIAAQVLGFSVLKAEGYLEAEVARWLNEKHDSVARWSIKEDYHCGGYGKMPRYLLDFIEEFKHHTGVPIEPVYTGKLFYGLFALIKAGFFAKDSHIVAIHTGGIVSNSH